MPGPESFATRLFRAAVMLAKSKALPESKPNPADEPSEEVVSIAKAVDEERLVYGVILEPDTPDVHGDAISAAEIQKAAHHYLTHGHDVRLQHGKKSVIGRADVVESFIAPQDMTMGEPTIQAGSWVMGAHVADATIWAKIKAGELTGFSPRGPAWRSLA